MVFFLPKATLAATIIVAVLSLVDLSILKKTWGYNRDDFAAVLATIVLTLGLGVEIGVGSGVAISILLHLYKTSRPHVAEVGLVPGSEHFRNIHRHEVETDPTLLTLRVDESLYFINARFLQDLIQERVTEGTTIKSTFKSKGRGFAGVVKRHNFAGGRASHGHRMGRRTGSIGNAEWPGRVQPGKKMPGQYGNTTNTVKNEVISFDAESGILVLKGSVSGANGALGKIRIAK